MRPRGEGPGRTDQSPQGLRIGPSLGRVHLVSTCGRRAGRSGGLTVKKRSRGACHSKCTAVSNGDALTTHSGGGGAVVGLAAARALCESMDACFMDHAMCKSKVSATRHAALRGTTLD